LPLPAGGRRHPATSRTPVELRIKAPDASIPPFFFFSLFFSFFFLPFSFSFFKAFAALRELVQEESPRGPFFSPPFFFLTLLLPSATQRGRSKSRRSCEPFSLFFFFSLPPFFFLFRVVSVAGGEQRGRWVRPFLFFFFSPFFPLSSLPFLLHQHAVKRLWEDALAERRDISITFFPFFLFFSPFSPPFFSFRSFPPACTRAALDHASRSAAARRRTTASPGVQLDFFSFFSFFPLLLSSFLFPHRRGGTRCSSRTPGALRSRGGTGPRFFFSFFPFFPLSPPFPSSSAGVRFSPWRESRNHLSLVLPTSCVFFFSFFFFLLLFFSSSLPPSSRAAPRDWFPGPPREDEEKQLSSPFFFFLFPPFSFPSYATRLDPHAPRKEASTSRRDGGGERIPPFFFSFPLRTCESVSKL